MLPQMGLGRTALLVALATSACREPPPPPDAPRLRLAERWADRSPEARGAAVASARRRLPDPDDASFSSTVALALADRAGGRLLGIGPADPRGAHAERHLTIALDGLAELEALMAALEPGPAPWRVEALARADPGWLVELVAAVYVPGSAGRLGSAGPADPTREAVALRRLEAAGIDADAQERLFEAEHRHHVADDLAPRFARARADLRQLLAAARRAEVAPRRLQFSVRRGRRQCAIELDDDVDRHRLARAAVLEAAAIDAEHTEIVLGSGRSCAVRVGDARP
jgi:hypothetical protein